MTPFHQAVIEKAKQEENRVIADRRDFHRYAEAGWTEFRTASLVARRLTELGYQVSLGRDVLTDETSLTLAQLGRTSMYELSDTLVSC